MEQKFRETNPDYLFKWEPEKHFLFFITQGAHVSGMAMKNLNEIQPRVVELLVEQVNKIKPTIGTVIEIDCVSKYVFIVSRKHYASKQDLKLVKSALASLKGNYKMSREDFPDIVRLVSTDFPNVELKNTSAWNSRNID